MIIYCCKNRFLAVPLVLLKIFVIFDSPTNSSRCYILLNYYAFRIDYVSDVFDPDKKTMVVVDENGKEATVRLNTDKDKGGIEVETAPEWTEASPRTRRRSRMSQTT